MLGLNAEAFYAIISVTSFVAIMCLLNACAQCYICKHRKRDAAEEKVKQRYVAEEEDVEPGGHVENRYAKSRTLNYLMVDRIKDISKRSLQAQLNRRRRPIQRGQ